ncbi:aspartyl-phosphate phosphatase Spo0E family protein [Paenibacillus sp. 7028]|nr:aspartyl-phosphate phosphatase Spo0E family protein [Paenibacillus apii]
MFVLEEIILRIEELRLELNRLANCKLLSDPELIHVSQLLDEVLNQYHRMIQLRTTK